MSFEYRELTTKVFLSAGEGDKPPCRNASCQNVTKEGDEGGDCCISCGSTTKGCDTNTCPPPPGDEKPDGEYRRTLGFLRQQLQDTLAAG